MAMMVDDVDGFIMKVEPFSVFGRGESAQNTMQGQSVRKRKRIQPNKSYAACGLVSSILTFGWQIFPIAICQLPLTIIIDNIDHCHMQ
mmetsp:Transcript_36285/g.87568  ORF Transcript_36285/g.87568 Transcript_36285/m.87568 type:complete len:88 (+) Transcript_36285:1151-1414(+)